MNIFLKIDIINANLMNMSKSVFNYCHETFYGVSAEHKPWFTVSQEKHKPWKSIWTWKVWPKQARKLSKDILAIMRFNISNPSYNTGHSKNPSLNVHMKVHYIHERSRTFVNDHEWLWTSKFTFRLGSFEWPVLYLFNSKFKKSLLNFAVFFEKW